MRTAPDGDTAIPLIHGSWLANRQDLVVALRLAARSVVRDPDLLLDAFRCAFVDAEVARARGHPSGQMLRRMLRDGLAALPDLRAAHPDVDAAAEEVAFAAGIRDITDPLTERPEPTRRRRSIRVAGDGFLYVCEVCSGTARCKSAKAAIVRPIDWGPLMSVRAPVPLISGQAASVFRLVVCCGDCRRRRIGRCEHEDFDGFDQRWVRCEALVPGSIYCDRHRTGRPAGARSAYQFGDDSGSRRAGVPCDDDYIARAAETRERAEHDASAQIAKRMVDICTHLGIDRASRLPASGPWLVPCLRSPTA